MEATLTDPHCHRQLNTQWFCQQQKFAKNDQSPLL